MLRKRLGGELALRCDLIGVTSILGDDANRWLDARARGAATDVRLRVAARHASQAAIDQLLREVTALWTCGPAGGGGARGSKRQRLSSRSCLLPRELAPARFALV